MTREEAREIAMNIRVERIGKEELMKLLGELTDHDEHSRRLLEARDKMEAAGYSHNALASFAAFAGDVTELAEIVALALTITQHTRDHGTAEFASRGIQWMMDGLDNCHDMMEKAGVDPEVFGLRPRSDGYREMLQGQLRDLRRSILEYTEYVLTDAQGNKKTINRATEGEAATEALTQLGYTLSRVRK